MKTRPYFELITEVIHANWNQPALTDYSVLQGEGGNDYTYGQMYEKIQWLCDRFAQLGLRNGDHVAICGENSANWVIAYLACSAYGAVSVPVLHSIDVADMGKLMAFSDTRALIVDNTIWKDTYDVLDTQVDVVLSMETFAILKQQPLSVSLAFDRIDNLSEICFTSGSTESPKGVMLSSHNICACILSVQRVYKAYDNKNMIAICPLAHSMSTMGEVLSPMSQGCHLYFFKQAYLADQLLEVFLQVKPFEVFLVPMLIERLLNNRYVEKFRVVTSFMDYCMTGGAVLKDDVAQKLKMLGIPLTNGYGVTESTAVISISSAQDYKMGACGIVCPDIEVKISPAGEILVRGENVMLGYYKDERATHEKIDAEGWLHTGDRGHLDEDGYLYVEGRMNQDMIVLPSGENIHPENIETIINQVPGVQESLVLAREGKLIALVRMAQPVVEDQYIAQRNALLAIVNPQLPAYAQLFGIEFISTPLSRTEKQTVKRYLYH